MKSPSPYDNTIQRWIQRAFSLSLSKGFTFSERDPLTTKRLAAAAHLMATMSADIEDIRRGDSKFDAYTLPHPLTPEREYQIACALLIVSELLEHLEALFCDHIDTTVKGKPEGPTIELADTFLRLFDYVGRFYSCDDILAALEKKQAYNETRPYKHGKKA